MKLYIINLIIILSIITLVVSTAIVEANEKIYFDKGWIISGYGAEIWFVYVDSNTHKLKRYMLYLETEPITEIYIIKDKTGYFEILKQYSRDVLIRIYLPEESPANKTLISEESYAIH